MILPREVLILIFTASGISLKLADNYEKEARGYIFAAKAAICMGFLLSDNPISSSIILGIIIGVSLAGKLDQLNLIFGLTLTLTTAVILGFTMPNIPLVIAVSVAALIDEVGHDNTVSRNILGKFFRFRGVLKSLMLILLVSGRIDRVYAVGFFCFDLAYDITGLIS